MAESREPSRSTGKAGSEVLVLDGVEVSISNPQKVLFPETGQTKLDLVNYYLAVADGALRGAGGRPNVLVRYPNGVGQDFFYQKRAPDKRPPWIEVVELSFPSGRTAEEVVPRSAATLAWMANLACLELHPHPVRAEDLDHPDELRVDLDPVPGIEWDQVKAVAQVVEETLREFGLVGWPKTSGSRGIHVNVRIERRWGFQEVRRAALALAREVERRAPTLATSKWWKEERHGVFIDYNQNAKDRTVAAAYSVRPKPDARVSAPLTWEEIEVCDPADFTLATMPARFAEIGDRHRDIDAHAGSLEALLELSARHEAEGLGDAPWPPQYQKQEGEPPRVQPSRRRKEADDGSSEAPAKGGNPHGLRAEAVAEATAPTGSATSPAAAQGKKKGGSSETPATSRRSAADGGGTPPGSRGRRKSAEPGVPPAVKSGESGQDAAAPRKSSGKPSGKDAAAARSFRGKRSTEYAAAPRKSGGKPSAQKSSEKPSAPDAATPRSRGAPAAKDAAAPKSRRKPPAGNAAVRKSTGKPAAKDAAPKPRVQRPAPAASSPSPSGRRTSKYPLIEIARASRKEDALAGLERWKARHARAAEHLEPADILVDSMRGRSSTWTRIRLNLRHVPPDLRPAQEPPDPDEKILWSS